MRAVHYSAFSVVVLMGAACSGGSLGPIDELDGGVLATFQVEAELFHLWVTNAQTVQQLFDLERGVSAADIPIGPLRAGAGQGDHNAPWSWHLDPVQTSMAEATIEVCSGLPSFVEDDLDTWLNNVGSYCPWSAVLVELEDFR